MIKTTKEVIVVHKTQSEMLEETIEWFRDSCKRKKETTGKYGTLSRHKVLWMLLDIQKAPLTRGNDV